MTKRSILIVAFLLCSLTLTRQPFFISSLCGEEGIFAHAVLEVARGEKPRILVARDLAGREYAAVPEHNLAGYALPGIMLKLIQWLPFVPPLDADTIDNRVQLGQVLRAVFFLIYLLAASLALQLVRRERRIIAAALILLFSLVSVPLFGSIQIQYDGAVSTALLIGSLVLLVTGLESSSQRLTLLAAATAGLLIALGKIEFVAISAGVWIGSSFWIKRREPGRRIIPAIMAYTAGLAAGSLISYLYDPANFVGGFHVAGRIAASTTPTLARRIAYIRQYANELRLPVATLGLLCFALWRSRGTWTLRVVAPALAAGATIIGFILIAWSGDGFPRYFAPAFLLLPVALVQLPMSRRLAWIATSLLVVEASVTYARAVSRADSAFCHVLRMPSMIEPAHAHAARTYSCIPKADGALGFYAAKSPFICCGFWDDPNAPAELRAQCC